MQRSVFFVKTVSPPPVFLDRFTVGDSDGGNRAQPGVSPGHQQQDDPLRREK